MIFDDHSLVEYPLLNILLNLFALIIGGCFFGFGLKHVLHKPNEYYYYQMKNSLLKHIFCLFKFWKSQESGDFDEETTDDWDVDMSVYYEKELY